MSLNVHKLCRLCQNKSGIHSVLQDELIKKIVECTGIKVDDNDNSLNSFPTKICHECKNIVNNFYQYMRRVRNVDLELRAKIKEHERFKKKQEEKIVNKNTVKVLYKCFLCSESYQDLNTLLIHQRTHTEIAVKEEYYEYDTLEEDKDAVFNNSNGNNKNIVANNNYDLKQIGNDFDDDYDYDAAFIQEEEIININVISDDNNEVYDENDLETILTGNYDVKEEGKDEIENIKCKNEGDKTLLENNSSDQPEDSKIGILLLPDRKPKEELVCKYINCNRKCSSKSILKVHQMKHENIFPFLCEFCGKAFTTRNSLRTHERVHSNVKFKCELCNFSCVSESYLKLHKRKHHDMVRYYCDQCTKTYLTKCSLERHQLLHTGSKEYQCETCPSAFYTRKELRKHQRYHQGIRLYHCNQCFKSFFEKHHLTIHLRIHSGERPYPCTIKGCTKAFNCSQKLTRHQKTRHN